MDNTNHIVCGARYTLCFNIDRINNTLPQDKFRFLQ